MKAQVRVGISLAVVVILAVACTSGPNGSGADGSRVSGGIPLLRVGHVGPYNTLDPAKAVFATPPLFESLMRVGPDESIEPQLATSVAHPNATTYVYTLRKDVKFWNGNPMTSADVVNSINYVRSPKQPTSSSFSSVKSVGARGAHTVEVVLKRPDPAWPAMAALAPVFEKKFADAHPDTMGNPGVLIQATGPWKVDTFDPNKGVELSANPHWWGGRVPIQRISMKFFSDLTSASIAAAAGEVDFVFPVGDPPKFTSAAGKKMKILSATTGIQGYFAMNTRRAPWNDINVRRAVAHALNQKEIIKALGGYAETAPTLFPRYALDSLGSSAEVKQLVASVPSYPFSLEKAKKELAKSAHPEGFTATIEINQYGSWPDALQVIAAQLERIGIKLEIKIIPRAAFLDKLLGEKTYGCMFFESGAVAPSVDQYARRLLSSAQIQSGGLNAANFNSTTMDRLIDEAANARQNDERRALYAQIMKNAAKEVPYVPLYVTKFNAALSNDFTWSGFSHAATLGTWPLYIRRA